MSIENDIVTCDSEGCGATVSLEEAKTNNTGWGYWFFRGVQIDECPECAGPDDEDEDWDE